MVKGEEETIAVSIAKSAVKFRNRRQYFYLFFKNDLFWYLILMDVGDREIGLRLARRRLQMR